MLYITGIIISFFLCLLLLGKKGKTAADYVLAFWMFWIGCHLSLYYLYISQRIYDLPFLLGLAVPMPLAHPPLLFLYTAALCRGTLPGRWWAHFLPISGCYLYMIPFSLLPVEQKIWVFQHKGAGYETFMFLVNIAINVSGVVYTILAHRLLRKHRRVITDLFSNEENVNLQWMQYLIYGLAIVWIPVLFGNDPLVFGAAVLFVLFIGHFGIRQTGIFTNPPALQLAQEHYDVPGFSFPGIKTESSPEADSLENTAAPSSDKKKYEKSGLSQEAAEALHRRLLSLMTDGQVFRESELSLTDLAARLDTHPNYLSQIINDKEGKNFYDYVNSMRVEAFLKMADDPKNSHYTLLAIALECGFNSKSAFNRYFRKATGRSPSSFLNSGMQQ